MNHFKTGNKTINSIASAFILVDIKAGLRSNSGLLEVNLTQRAAKINVLDGYAYPELRLINIQHYTEKGYLIASWH